MDIGGLVSQLAASSTIPIISAFLIGLLAAISPCPLATNIAAVAYISQRASERRYAVTAASLYTLGRVFSYSLIGILIIAIGLGVAPIATFLQDVGEKWLGPILIVVGVLFLFVDKLHFGGGSGRLQRWGSKIATRGPMGAFFLGVLFALAFCPFTAIMFFGVLIPLSLESTAGVLLPPVFAIGTGLPVLLFGILLSFGVGRVTSWVNTLNRAQPVIRIVVALIFIGAGIYCIVR